MRQIREQEVIDRILRYLVDNKSDLPINVYKIHKEVFPNQEQHVIFYLIKKHLLGKKDIISTVVRDDDLENFDVYLGATSLTDSFLKQGGFTGEFEKVELEKKEKDRLDALQKEKLEAEVDIARFQKGLGKKLIVWGFVVTVISVLASVLTTIVQNKNDNKVEVDSLSTRIDGLTNRLIELEKKLKDSETVGRDSSRLKVE